MHVSLCACPSRVTIFCLFVKLISNNPVQFMNTVSVRKFIVFKAIDVFSAILIIINKIWSYLIQNKILFEFLFTSIKKVAK